MHTYMYLLTHAPSPHHSIPYPSSHTHTSSHSPRSLLESSLVQTHRLVTHLKSAKIPILWHGRAQGEPAPCCNNCLVRRTVFHFRNPIPSVVVNIGLVSFPDPQGGEYGNETNSGPASLLTALDPGTACTYSSLSPTNFLPHHQPCLCVTLSSA